MKAIRFIYAAITYVMFFLFVFSAILNLISLTASLFTEKPFSVDYWELGLIPFIILIEVLYFRPIYPNILQDKRQE